MKLQTNRKKARFILLIPILTLATLSGCTFQLERTGVFRKIFHSFDYEKLPDYRKAHIHMRKGEPGERMKRVPEEYLKYLRNLDENASYENYILTEQEEQIVKRAIENLPGPLREVLEEKNLGIYFVDQFLTSGMTDWIVNEDHDLSHVLVFNPLTLKMSASDILTWRERTAFREDSSHNYVRITLDGVHPAFEYILLHEVAHAYDMEFRITPYLEKDIEILQRENETPAFMKECWVEYRQASESCGFEKRDLAAFYGLGSKEPIPAKEMPAVYEGLMSSSFVSLYGSLSWAEDFAELVAYYHIQKRYGSQPVIHIFQSGKLLERYRPMEKAKIRDRIRRAGALTESWGEKILPFPG